MSGMNRVTGRSMEPLDHIAQSIEVILTTRLGERVMREWFGTPGNLLLGENLTQPTILRWWGIVWAALTIFEPRFVPRRLSLTKATTGGEAGMTIEGDYRLYAHLGFEQAALYIAVTSSGVVVRKAS